MAEPETGEERFEPLHPHGLDDALEWVGHRLDEVDGTTIGKIEEILVDADAGVPDWLVVKLGRVGGHRTVVPFELAAGGVGHVWVPYSKEAIRAAPAVARGTGLDAGLEQALRTHYGIAPGPGAVEAGAGPEGSNGSGGSEAADDADDDAG